MSTGARREYLKQMRFSGKRRAGDGKPGVFPSCSLKDSRALAQFILIGDANKKKVEAYNAPIQRAALKIYYRLVETGLVLHLAETTKYFSPLDDEESFSAGCF